LKGGRRENVRAVRDLVGIFEHCKDIARALEALGGVRHHVVFRSHLEKDLAAILTVRPVSNNAQHARPLAK
jgi:hypothetical protein